MKRVPLLNSYQSGFHARSRLLDSSMARLAMEVMQGRKEYIDPVLDVGSDVFVFDRPVECLNMLTPDRERPNPNPEGGYLTRGPTEALIPYHPHEENWSWKKAIALCDEESSIRWRFFPGLSCYRKEKLPGRTVEIGWQSFFCPRRNTGQWYFWLGWRPYQDTPAGRDLTGRIGRALEGILRISGLHRWITPRWNENTKDWAVDILALEEDLPEDQPRLGLDTGPSIQDPPTVPRGPAESLDLCNRLIIPQISFYLMGELFREILNHLQSPGDGILNLKFRPDETDIPAFRKWAENRFGCPWLQLISGWATRSPSPDDIDDSLPDWVLLPVAYFKILGSRRIVTVVKEPGGWRFHVTGKYTKDPLKHRHIRDELARKAGMTSETLWEPQEAGEGWLGVPG